MHHIALNGSGPNNSDLDNQIIEAGGLESGQHRHLCPGFDLKDA